MKSNPVICPVSIIVTFRNHKTSLTNCIESIQTSKIVGEIILLDLGSSDGSVDIVQSYQTTYQNIKIVPQPFENIGMALNYGIGISKGEYIIFMDPDDSIAPESMGTLYRSATQTQPDIITGKLMDLATGRILSMVPNTLRNSIVSGPEGFISLMKLHRYTPKGKGYMFKRDFLNRCNLRFDENTLNPEELWTQSAFCAADKALFTDIDFYYLKSEKSPICDIDKQGPLYAKDQLHIGDSIFELAERYSFEGNEGTLKSWIYVNGLRVYASAFRIVTAIRMHSVFDLPAHRMHSFKDIKDQIPADILARCKGHYSRAAAFENEYLVWRGNPCDPIIDDMTEEQLRDKRIILVYNSPAWQDYEDTLKNLPPNYVLTLDRKYKDQAFAIVFYMPGLNEHVYSDLDKPEGQIWIRWNMEPETRFGWMLDEELDDIFDLRMDYHSYAEVVCPYYANFKSGKISRDINPAMKKNKVCMLISSAVNQSKREEYLKELMQYTGVDSYGRLFRNSSMPGEDKGWESKIDLYGQYKFVVAFENSILEDYVTEKLYDPLLAGAVPVYLGAPNVQDFVPGDKCLVNAADFASARELADYINLCYEDEEEYMSYHQWRNKPWNASFVHKVDIQDDSPFIRLCRLLDQH